MSTLNFATAKPASAGRSDLDARCATRRWRRSTRDPLLSAFLYSTILNQETLEEAVIHRIAERLDHQDFGADLIRQTFKAMLADEPEWATIVRVDIQAYYDRDPACDRFLMPVLYFKGFHAIQTHRLAHWLWTARAARTSRSICRAGRPRCSRPTSIRPPGWARASSSTMPPGWSSARPPSSRMTCRSCMA